MRGQLAVCRIWVEHALSEYATASRRPVTTSSLNLSAHIVMNAFVSFCSFISSTPHSGSGPTPRYHAEKSKVSRALSYEMDVADDIFLAILTSRYSLELPRCGTAKDSRVLFHEINVGNDLVLDILIPDTLWNFPRPQGSP